MTWWGWALIAWGCFLAFALFYGFRLAKWREAQHIAQPAAPAVKEDTVASEDPNVASILARAEGAAEAMTDCGIDTDDTELCAQFIDNMGTVRGELEAYLRPVWEQCVANHPADEVHDFHTSLANLLRGTTAITNVWFLWRLSAMVRNMASADVLEAARKVVADPSPTNLRALHAALPKER